jgi:hypothetical protein
MFALHKWLNWRRQQIKAAWLKSLSADGGGSKAQSQEIVSWVSNNYGNGYRKYCHHPIPVSGRHLTAGKSETVRFG